MEILSPSSNLEHIQVAIDGKANAVYGGLKKWNARNKAINFTDEEYNYLIKELHKNNIKFFLTLNILMLDEEVEEVIDFLKHNSLPDAFIVTDIGLILKLKNEFPNVPLHFSTQFGCHNIDDVNFVKSIGGERAILARELTLSEIENIRINTDIELECFIWGSQCLSFSGLCFFGTLINGGGGNRGKCLITCRDIYSINGNRGHYLYVPDMDCINLISKLKDIDCLKLEGRRRNPKEIKKILDQIVEKKESKKNVGYLYGKNISQNGLYEKINSRIKPVMPASELNNPTNNDICIRYENNIPIEFSTDYDNNNVYYIYSEIKKKYDVNKKNIWLDFNIDNNILKEAIYVNYKGDGHTFISNNTDYIELNIDEFISNIEKNNSMINVYKIKYQRNNNKIIISKELYNEMKNYILNDCKAFIKQRKYNGLVLKKVYMETTNFEVIDEFINDKFIKIIYDIETIEKLKEIDKAINLYGDRIIYKLPLFNWNSDNIEPYLKKLEDKEIMFTRFPQIELTKNIKFKKKYTDYTIYIWNKHTLDYLLDNGINEFTASPELSYERNQYIFSSYPRQVIICGKLPLVYTRNCFSHVFGCKNCHMSQNNLKNIKNEDKNLDFEVLCNSDFRYVLNNNPILNDYTTIDVDDTTLYRYNTIGQSLDIIEETIECLKSENYYKALKDKNYYAYSYECNLIEGKE